MCVCFFFLTGDNSYLSTVQIIDSLGPRRVQVDRGGSAGCAGLPEIYRDSSIPRGERGKYAIRVGRTVFLVFPMKYFVKNLRKHVDFKYFRCRRLPRALKEWQAYQDLKQKIDDFSESCPLLELMANKAMKERHWDRIAKLTGHTFDFDSENFTLRDIMKAPLLKHKEDIEANYSIRLS